MLTAAASAALLAQSSAPDTSGSDPIIVIVGVLLITGIIGFVVARRSRR